MSDPIRESVAAALQAADGHGQGYEYIAGVAIAAHLSALEAQGLVVVRHEPFSGPEYTCRHAGGCRHPEKCRPEGCAGRPSGMTLADVLRAASNKETGL